MKQFCIIILLVLGIITGNSCKKQPENTPGQRTKTISAKINGVAWQNHSCWTCIGGGSGITSDFSTNILGIQGQQNKIYIDFQIGQITGLGTYFFNAKGSNNGKGNYLDTATSSPNGDINYYDTNDSLPGSVTITTFDTINKIIEGNFSFDAANRYNPALIVHITEGKFTIYY